jgi:hypothetical protein
LGSPSKILRIRSDASKREVRSKVMPRFTIVPTDQVDSSTDVTAMGADAVLHKINRLHCKAADVHRDGKYVFSVQASDRGVWTIFQRDRELPPNLASPVMNRPPKRKKQGNDSRLMPGQLSAVDSGQRALPGGTANDRRRPHEGSPHLEAIHIQRESECK